MHSCLHMVLFTFTWTLQRLYSKGPLLVTQDLSN